VDREGAVPAFPPHPSGNAVFPLLVKFLFTTDKLSVQVHPPDSYARDRAASWGKTEMWHVLRAAPGARLAVGFREDVAENVRLDRQAFRQALTTGAIEQMLDWIEPRVGDTFFVPAGTVHAIGHGLVLCEIQQNSDITYRLYDYNRPGTDGRPRPLHVDQALDVMQRHTVGGRTAPLELPTAAGARQCLAACPYFATERWTLEQPFEQESTGRLEIWICLEGEAQFGSLHPEPARASDQNRLPTPYSPLPIPPLATCKQGEVIVIPADVRSFVLRPQSPCVFLRTFPPDLENDILAPLRARGVSEDQLRRVYFPMSQVAEKAAP
jgi:mannose-6-phosphate isomerase